MEPRRKEWAAACHGVGRKPGDGRPRLQCITTTSTTLSLRSGFRLFFMVSRGSVASRLHPCLCSDVPSGLLFPLAVGSPIADLVMSATSCGNVLNAAFVHRVATALHFLGHGRYILPHTTGQRYPHPQSEPLTSGSDIVGTKCRYRPRLAWISSRLAAISFPYSAMAFCRPFIRKTHLHPPLE